VTTEATGDGANQTEDLPGSKAAVLAWLEERTATEEGQEIGTLLFLADETSRPAAAMEAMQLVKAMLSSADSQEIQKVTDALFLNLYICGAQVGAWLGADAWPASLSKASVPGLLPKDVLRAALAGIDSQVVKEDETQKILDAYVTATWGDEASLIDAVDENFDGIMVSTPPQQASIQYCLGILWGYAFRGMVKRLALDRQLDTVPESLAAQRWQLERALAIDFNTSSSKPGPPTFMQYANEFFSHEQWAELCRPSNAAVILMEAELQEAMHAMAILSSVSQDDDMEVISSSEEEFENDFELDLVLLDQAEWKAFQYRAVAYGSLVADAEALVEAEVPLERSDQSWVTKLVQTRVLTDIRPDQSRMVAAGIQAPIRRVVQVLREKVLQTKLTEARSSLTKMMADRAAAAGTACAAAAQDATEERDGEQADNA